MRAARGIFQKFDSAAATVENASKQSHDMDIGLTGDAVSVAQHGHTPHGRLSYAMPCHPARHMRSNCAASS